MDLQTCALEFPSDKCKIWGHDYISSYEQLFSYIKSNVKNVLEIGIGCRSYERVMRNRTEKYNSGNSLRMWKQYFYSANIYGIDINYDAMITGETRIKTYIIDQSSHIEMLIVVNKVNAPLDIVIDDGSHIPIHQAKSFCFLEPYLSEKAIYVIEDVSSESFESFKDLSIFPEDYREIIKEKYTVKIFDTRSQTGISDDILFCLIKK
jgi:hypothetical protein